MEVAKDKGNSLDGILNGQGWLEIVLLSEPTHLNSLSRSFFLDASLALPEYVKLTSHLLGRAQKDAHRVPLSAPVLQATVFHCISRGNPSAVASPVLRSGFSNVCLLVEATCWMID